MNVKQGVRFDYLKQGTPVEEACIDVPMKRRGVPLAEFLSNAENHHVKKHGNIDMYYKYSGLEHNCQAFIMTLLEGNSLSSPKIKTFVLQSVEQLKNSVIVPLLQTATDLGGVSDLIMKGGKLKGGGKKLTETEREQLERTIEEYHDVTREFKRIYTRYLRNPNAQNFAEYNTIYDRWTELESVINEVKEKLDLDDLEGDVTI